MYEYVHTQSMSIYRTKGIEDVSDMPGQHIQLTMNLHIARKGQNNYNNKNDDINMYYTWHIYNPNEMART